MDSNLVAENFIEEIIIKDLTEGRVQAVQMRHPPEPSGYLHIGHVRNLMLNYGLAEKFGGVCNLRYDDTNPVKESQEFVDAIQEDVKWMGYHWKDIHYATDYFQQNYEIALKLIREGKAFVCELSPQEVSEYRGTLTTPGKNSPYRDRSVEENLALFEKMKNGEFAQGACCLRAKIDMTHPNMNMRDPVIYRIQFQHHQRIGNTWNIYPTYDFSHPLDDALEGVTHSICGPEFEDHRPLYNWVVENSGLQNRPQQIEYANLCIRGTILGKRNIKKLVQEGKVWGFDDPRIYTLRGLRRRGVLPQSLLNFVKATGVGKSSVLQEQDFLNFYIRETLNEVSLRVMAVLNPLKLVLTNFAEGESREVVLSNYPQNPGSDVRTYRIARELFIEREDFEKEKTPGFFRLYPGNTVRLMGAYAVTCTGFECDEQGQVTCVYAECLENKEIKTKATIHWVNPANAKRVEARLFENLVDQEDEEAVEGQEKQVEVKINPDSLKIVKEAYIEDDVLLDFDLRYQFVRNGYFCLDSDSHVERGHYVFNRTISLRDKQKSKKQ